MSEYVSQVILEINGQEIEDFNSVTVKDVELAKAVNLMNKTGVTRVMPRYGVELEYVVPADAPEFDFEGVWGATLTIDKQNGVRETYSGVYVLKVGSAKYDGEKEATRNIECIATSKR